MAVRPSIVSLVYQRDMYQCVHCGTTNGLSLQHRINRQMGGSKLRDTVQNLIVMCWDANMRLESSAGFAERGMAAGWKLRSWQDPLVVPVFYAPEGAFFVLTERGTRVRVDEAA